MPENSQHFGRLLAAMVAIALVTLGVSQRAEAQLASQFDLNQFRPSELATDGFAVSTADGQGHLKFGVQVYLDFARNPLEVRITNLPGSGDQQFPLVHGQLTGHLTWSLGLWERLVIFMDLPYHFILKDNLTEAQEMDLATVGLTSFIPNGRGLGDLYVGARGVLYGERENIFQLAVQATLTTNTATAARPNQNYLGDAGRSPNIGGWFEVLGTFNAGRFIRIPLNIGYKTGFTQDVPSLGIGNQFTFGGGLQALLGQDRFMLTVESFGRTAAQSSNGFGGARETPLELLGGFKYLDKRGFSTGIALTGGLTTAFGSPDWRIIGMLAYTMPEKDKPVDTDGDGIIDELDACPTEPEDFDGFQDEDGCPDLDNDGDGIVDADDACPNEPGPPENNGCPDPDRDGDGVVDRLDNCPDEPGPAENQGCPAEQIVVIEETQLQLLEKIYFDFDSAKLQERSHAVLDNVAAVLKSHPEVTLVRVEGHTDSRGNDAYNMRLSQRRAESVVRYLVKAGVNRGRLAAEGFGESDPLIPGASTEEEYAKNRRVEFEFVEEAVEVVEP
ncbi:MAG: OmpA family protein [Myxococcota bacterium]